MATLIISYWQDGAALTGTNEEFGRSYSWLFKQHGFSWWPRQKEWRTIAATGTSSSYARALRLAEALNENDVQAVIQPRSQDAMDDLGANLSRIIQGLAQANRRLSTWSVNTLASPGSRIAPCVLATGADLALRLELGAELSAVTAQGERIAPRVISKVTYDTAQLEGNDQTSHRQIAILFGNAQRYEIVDANSFAAVSGGRRMITYRFVREGIATHGELPTKLRQGVRIWEERLVDAVSEAGTSFWPGGVPVGIQSVVDRLRTCGDRGLRNLSAGKG